MFVAERVKIAHLKTSELIKYELCNQSYFYSANDFHSQVVKTSVSTSNSPSQDFTNPDDQSTTNIDLSGHLAFHSIL